MLFVVRKTNVDQFPSVVQIKNTRLLVFRIFIRRKKLQIFWKLPVFDYGVINVIG
jgi:hypothetical protein